MANKEEENKCNLCKKDRKNFNGFVWYHHEYEEYFLCRSCYLKWCKSGDCKVVEKKYKKAKPCTKLWNLKCKHLAGAFANWFNDTKKELKSKLLGEELKDEK